jgi:hypothetical protein
MFEFDDRYDKMDDYDGQSWYKPDGESYFRGYSKDNPTPKEWFTIEDAVVIHSTAKAHFIGIIITRPKSILQPLARESHSLDVWVPKSQCKVNASLRRVEVQLWFYRQELEQKIYDFKKSTKFRVLSKPKRCSSCGQLICDCHELLTM